MTATELVRREHEKTNLTGSALATYIRQHCAGEIKAQGFRPTTIKQYCSMLVKNGKTIVKPQYTKKYAQGLKDYLESIPNRERELIAPDVPGHWEVIRKDDPRIKPQEVNPAPTNEPEALALLRTLKRTIGIKGIITLAESV